MSTEDQSPQSVSPEPIHNWFELSYAQYLTIPRSVLQSMPVVWQNMFVQLMETLDETIDWRPQQGCYRVTLNEVDQTEGWMWGKELTDPLADYERGRRRIPYKEKPKQPEFYAYQQLGVDLYDAANQRPISKEEDLVVGQTYCAMGLMGNTANWLCVVCRTATQPCWMIPI